MLLHVLDLIGVFAFASFGSYKGLQKHMDLFGIFVCATLTALGGGAIRDVALNHRPVFLTNYTSIGVVLLATIFTILVYHHFHKLNRYMLTLDAIGLTAFAFIGADQATRAGLGLGGIIFCALITAVGGGVLSDLLVGRSPQLFYGDFYAAPAVIMAIGFWSVQRLGWDLSPVHAFSLIISVFALRIVALYLRWGIWRPLRPTIYQTTKGS